MFDTEKLLGQLMGDAFSGALGGKRRKHKRSASGLSGLMGGMSTGTKAKIGVGLLGLAYAAYEHYKQSENPSAAATNHSSQPPPPPIQSAGTPPPPPAHTPGVSNEQALHLIRAMITAADADGLIDASERDGILSRARQAGLNTESIRALEVEIDAPMNLKQLVTRTPEELRDDTYAAALIAITADTEEEKQFLEQLASGLKLDPTAREDIHKQLGL